MSDPRIISRWTLAAFVVTVVVTRIITTTLHLRGAGTDGGILINGVHIHHMVFGLILLAVVSTLWLVRQGRDMVRRVPVWEAIGFGVAWALILDESALIINLSDVYWSPEGDSTWSFIFLFTLILLWLSFRPLPKNRR